MWGREYAGFYVAIQTSHPQNDQTQDKAHKQSTKVHENEVKVTKIKKQNHNPEVPLSPPPSANTTFPPHLFVSTPPSLCLFHSPLPVSSPWSGGRQRVSARTQRSLWELLWLAVLRSTVHNRLRHGELPLTAFLCCSCGFDTVTPTPTLPLTLQPLSSLFRFVSFTLLPFIFKAPPPPNLSLYCRSKGIS